MVKKVCNTCQELKGIHLFYKQKTGMLGRTGSCKECRGKYQKQYSLLHKEQKNFKERERYKKIRVQKLDKYRIWRRENPDYFKHYYWQNLEKKKAIDKRWRMKNPDRIKAYCLLKKAIENGSLIKSSRCCICGEISQKIHGHHHDYSKPLEVIWVCQTCHFHIHKKVRKIKSN